jgi:short-subunit dehydrogenase
MSATETKGTVLITGASSGMGAIYGAWLKAATT